MRALNSRRRGRNEVKYAGLRSSATPNRLTTALRLGSSRMLNASSISGARGVAENYRPFQSRIVAFRVDDDVLISGTFQRLQYAGR